MSGCRPVVAHMDGPSPRDLVPCRLPADLLDGGVMTDGSVQVRQDLVSPATSRPERPEILVGYDESPGSRAALRWAASQAEAFETSLLVLYAADPPIPLPWTSGTLLPGGSIVRHSAAKVARDAADTVRKAHPATRVRSEGAVGSPAAELVSRSQDAAFVVVGRGRRRRTTELGSVSFALSVHARCPVVVVQGEPERGVGPGRPVVVGVDASRSSTRALTFAASLASRNGAELVVVSAWASPEREPWMGQLWSDPGRAADLVAGAFAGAVDTVAEAVTQVQRDVPGLAVSGRTPEGGAPEALLVEAEQAGRVVVGSRGRGGFPGLVLGSVGRAMLRQDQLPVAVVREGAL